MTTMARKIQILDLPYIILNLLASSIFLIEMSHLDPLHVFYSVMNVISILASFGALFLLDTKYTLSFFYGLAVFVHPLNSVFLLYNESYSGYSYLYHIATSVVIILGNACHYILTEIKKQDAPTPKEVYDAFRNGAR